MSKGKSSLLHMLFSSSPAKIWRSPISWRITLAVFATILTVQVAIFGLTITDHEQKILDRLKQEAKAAVMQAIPGHESATVLDNPVSVDEWTQIAASTKITGLSVYSNDYFLLGHYGDLPIIQIMKAEDITKTYWSADGSFYEFTLRPYELNARPFVMVLRVASDNVLREKTEYARQNLIIFFLMAGFVTSVLMLALSRWLLEPILFLRQSLLSAVKNPENPQLIDPPFKSKDEMTQSIDIAHNLIKENAANIKKIKLAAQDQIHNLAYFDQLTQLPNRTLFIQKLSEFTRSEGDPENEIKRAAIVTIDLDHFKDVNDSMGHNVGDALLRAVGKRLRQALPETAIVARTGEDEYAVMMPLSTSLNTAMDVGERVLRTIRSEPFKVFNENFQLRASIGVSTYPDNGTDPDQVLKNADIALNRAKEEGRDTIKEYSEDFDRVVQQRFQMLRDLRDALENNHLDLFFQPQFDLARGHIIGAEALIRWFKQDNSKEGGSFIPPGVFIPIAEQSGLIVPIGEWVLHKACHTAAEWVRQTGQDIRVAVNVSGAQFLQSDLVTYTAQVLKESGLPPHLLELEVTESAFMEDIEHTVTTLKELHALGIELAIDDFGTGYSSLSYLRQFPIDRLKIDQSFIRNALNDANDASITKTIITLGRALNLKVIAEGVETKEHEDFLRFEGCDEVQGFRYSKPVPYNEFLAFIKKYQGSLSEFG
ncbi:MAG: EAL domain-containing protein [Rhodospirillales bacterium]|nr:EAL domain-containing protein [Rhodospirillales bacterium]